MARRDFIRLRKDAKSLMMNSGLEEPFPSFRFDLKEKKKRNSSCLCVSFKKLKGETNKQTECKEHEKCGLVGIVKKNNWVAVAFFIFSYRREHTTSIPRRSCPFPFISPLLSVTSESTSDKSSVSVRIYENNPSVGNPELSSGEHFFFVFYYSLLLVEAILLLRNWWSSRIVLLISLIEMNDVKVDYLWRSSSIIMSISVLPPFCLIAESCRVQPTEKLINK